MTRFAGRKFSIRRRLGKGASFFVSAALALTIILCANQARAGKLVDRFGVSSIELDANGKKLLILGYDFQIKNPDFPIKISAYNTLLVLLPVNQDKAPDIQGLNVFQNKTMIKTIEVWDFEYNARFALIWFQPGFDRTQPYSIELVADGKADMLDLSAKDVKRLVGISRRSGPVLPPVSDDPFNKAFYGIGSEYIGKALDVYESHGLKGLDDLAVKSLEAKDPQMALVCAKAVIDWMPITRPEPDNKLEFRAWKIAGLALIELKKPQAARIALEKAAKLNKKDEEVKEALKKLEIQAPALKAEPPVFTRDQSKIYPGENLPGANEIKEGVGANGLVLGMGKDEIISRCGTPEHASGFKLKFARDNGCAGFVLLSPHGRALMITVMKGRTAKGITPGAKVQSLRAAYGKPPIGLSEPLPGFKKASPRMKRYSYVNHGVSFQDVDGDDVIDTITVFPASIKPGK